MIGKIVTQSLHLGVFRSVQLCAWDMMESYEVNATFKSFKKAYYLAGMSSGVVDAFKDNILK